MSAALRALLEHVVDYAGLYPPANADVLTAARNYASYRASDDRWMLGRFVVGVAKLGGASRRHPFAATGGNRVAGDRGRSGCRRRDRRHSRRR